MPSIRERFSDLMRANVPDALKLTDGQLVIGDPEETRFPPTCTCQLLRPDTDFSNAEPVSVMEIGSSENEISPDVRANKLLANLKETASPVWSPVAVGILVTLYRLSI